MSSSEDDLQKEIVRWYNAEYPEFQLSMRASQSGGYRGRGRNGAIRTARLKAMGAITGEADIAILLPRGGYGSLLIELKRDDAMAGPTEAQLDYVRYHLSIGNCACVAKGEDMAKAAIRQYMSGSKPPLK